LKQGRIQNFHLGYEGPSIAQESRRRLHGRGIWGVLFAMQSAVLAAVNPSDCLTVTQHPSPLRREQCQNSKKRLCVFCNALRSTVRVVERFGGRQAL